jgi:hypothetical protein
MRPLVSFDHFPGSFTLGRFFPQIAHRILTPNVRSVDDHDEAQAHPDEGHVAY